MFLGRSSTKSLDDLKDNCNSITRLIHDKNKIKPTEWPGSSPFTVLDVVLPLMYEHEDSYKVTTIAEGTCDVHGKLTKTTSKSFVTLLLDRDTDKNPIFPSEILAVEEIRNDMTNVENSIILSVCQSRLSRNAMRAASDASQSGPRAPRATSVDDDSINIVTEYRKFPPARDRGKTILDVYYCH